MTQSPPGMPHSQVLDEHEKLKHIKEEQITDGPHMELNHSPTSSTNGHLETDPHQQQQRLHHQQQHPHMQDQSPPPHRSDMMHPGVPHQQTNGSAGWDSSVGGPPSSTQEYRGYPPQSQQQYGGWYEAQSSDQQQSNHGNSTGHMPQLMAPVPSSAWKFVTVLWLFIYQMIIQTLSNISIWFSDYVDGHKRSLLALTVQQK